MPPCLGKFLKLLKNQAELHLHDVGEPALNGQVQRSLAVKVPDIDRRLGEVDEHLDGLEEAARGRVVQRRVAVPIADREWAYPGGQHQPENVELILKWKVNVRDRVRIEKSLNKKTQKVKTKLCCLGRNKLRSAKKKRILAKEWGRRKLEINAVVQFGLQLLKIGFEFGFSSTNTILRLNLRIGLENQIFLTIYLLQVSKGEAKFRADIT